MRELHFHSFCSSPSNSSIVGSCPLNSTGMIWSVFHSVIPMGLPMSRKTYSATIRLFSLRSMRPILGLSVLFSSSRLFACFRSVKKSKQYGSLSTAFARSNCGAGSGVPKAIVQPAAETTECDF